MHGSRLRNYLCAQVAGYPAGKLNITGITSDNPGPENPLNIIDEVAEKSLLVLLGKGTDEYQIIKGVKHRFSEREIIQAL